MILAAALAASLLLPVIWPEPSISARFFPADGDPSVVISIGSWHSNVRVFDISFCVNLDTPNVHGQAVVCPEALYSNPGRGAGIVRPWTLNWLTFPRHQEIKLTLPLVKLARDGSIPSGRLRGWLAVSVIDAKPGRSRGGLFLSYLERLTTVRVPFELEWEKPS